MLQYNLQCITLQILKSCLVRGLLEIAISFFQHISPLFSQCYPAVLNLVLNHCVNHIGGDLKEAYKMMRDTDKVECQNLVPRVNIEY